MSRYFNRIVRWSAPASSPITPPSTAPIAAPEVVAAPVVGETPIEIPAADIVVSVKKHTGENGIIVCEILAEGDCDEIRYNIGSKKVTAKNRTKCKLYAGEFELEEDSTINASAFKAETLVGSAQG